MSDRNVSLDPGLLVSDKLFSCTQLLKTLTGDIMDWQHRSVVNDFLTVVSGEEPLIDDATEFDDEIPYTDILVSEERVIPRVFNGTSVWISDYPYMVSVRFFKEHHCGGSLIAPDWVLTAAQCLMDRDSNDDYVRKHRAEDMGAWMGTNDVRGTILPSDAQERLVACLTPHPEYSNTTNYADIGLLRLAKPFELTPGVQLIELPTSSELDTPPEGMTDCHVTGWGFTVRIAHDEEVTAGELSETLMMGALEMISMERCRNVSGDMFQKCLICSGVDRSTSSDACGGDQGGPVVCSKIQVGIISAGVGCGWEGKASGHTRTDCFLNWIRQEKKKAESANGGNSANHDVESRTEKTMGRAMWWVFVVMVIILGVVLAGALVSIIYKAVNPNSSN